MSQITKEELFTKDLPVYWMRLEGVWRNSAILQWCAANLDWFYWNGHDTYIFGSDEDRMQLRIWLNSGRAV